LASMVSAIWNRNGMPAGLMNPGFVLFLKRWQRVQKELKMPAIGEQ